MAFYTRLARLTYRLKPVAIKLTESAPPKSAARISRATRLPVELSCCLESMMPLHSAIASARLRSSLSIEAKCWGVIPQDFEKENYWKWKDSVRHLNAFMTASTLRVGRFSQSSL